MSALPVSVLSYLHGLVAQDRAPAYLLVDRDGNLCAWDGALAAYGLTDLQAGAPVSEQVYWLPAQFPLECDEVLELVQVEAGPHVDIHFFRAEEGDYVLLLAAQEKHDRQFVMQQKGNELARKEERLVKETQKKEVLLHCIVHDLAGPLLGIKGGFELLNSENLTPQGRKFIEIGLRQANKQETLIREILRAFAAEMDAVEAFTIEPAHAPDAAQAVKEVAEALLPAFTINNVKLQIDPLLDFTRDWKVVGEKSRLERVVSNLLENALRHSPADTTVTIGCTEADDGRVMVTIDDEGAGVPLELANRLFQKFAQGKKGKGKVGLGLYFCRVTVEHWGGLIGHTPRTGKGTRFWFSLPRPRINKDAASNG